MASDDRFFIGPGLRDKLREVIRASDSARASRGGEIPTVLQSMTPPSGGGGVVEAYFTGGWVKGQEKQITFAANTASAATAVNLIRTVPIASGQTSRICTVAPRTKPVNSTEAKYVLINTEC